MNFSKTFVCNISHSKKRWARYDNKCTLVLMLNTRNSSPILMKPEFSRQIFENYSIIKFRENPSIGSQVVPCGQTVERTDRRTCVTNLTVTFRNFANAPENCAFCISNWVSLRLTGSTSWLKPKLVHTKGCSRWLENPILQLVRLEENCSGGDVGDRTLRSCGCTAW
jgi:hypothetical protein